jgi:serine O-acetyltransferase
MDGSPAPTPPQVRLAVRLLTPIFAPLLMLIGMSPAAGEVWEDACAWERPLGPRAVSSRDGQVLWLTYLLAKHPEFRTLAYYRVAQHGLRWLVGTSLAKLIFRPQAGMSIDCPSIGPRLFFEHAHGSTITAERIGADCWINQNVTIGYENGQGRRPVIGDGVYIRTGAVVVGGIVVHDGAQIGANAVVRRDVEPADTVAGVPARSLRARSAAEP